MSSRVIAIDGPAGSGKSTTARAVAERLGLAHLDSGGLYRATALVVLEDQLPIDGARVVRGAENRAVELRDVAGSFRPYRAGEDVTELVRSQAVTGIVSAVAALRPVRKWVTAALREAVVRHSRGAVADGRDIGTVVFPDAALKIFLTASLAERARRRAREQGNGDMEDLTGMSDALLRRDEQDSNRALAPLAAADDAVHIDTTDLTFEEQVEAIVAHAAGLARG